jgi:hypothetical protein
MRTLETDHMDPRAEILRKSIRIARMIFALQQKIGRGKTPKLEALRAQLEIQKAAQRRYDQKLEFAPGAANQVIGKKIFSCGVDITASIVPIAPPSRPTHSWEQVTSPQGHPALYCINCQIYIPQTLVLEVLRENCPFTEEEFSKFKEVSHGAANGC